MLNLLQSSYTLYIALGMFAALLAALWLGRRLQRRAKAGADAGSGLIEAAVFGLLGLLIAFQVNGAANRLERRRELVVQETAAVGTAWLRLEMLPEAPRAEIRGLVRTWLDARVRSRQADVTVDQAIELVDQARALEPRIWTLAVDASRADGWPPTATLLLPSLNQMFDIAAARDVAALTHAPGAMLSLLVGAALLGALLAGRAQARAPNAGWVPGVAFAAILAIAAFVLLDMEFPRRGIITIGRAETMLQDLHRSLQAP